MTELLRPMVIEDIADVVQIEREVQGHPWSHQLFAESVNGNDQCWVLELKEQLVGYGVLKTIAGESELLTISIAPGFQGRGLGRKLLEALKSKALEEPADTLFLEVRASNKTALGLYQSSGFQQVGLRKNYYPNPDGSREDALVMSTSLHHS